MFKYITVVLFVQLLGAKCQYDGDSCNAAGQPGTCTVLSQCAHLVSEIKNAGSPMPLHMRKKLEALKCGFHGNEPLICCSTDSYPDSIPNRGGEKPGQTDDAINTVGSIDNVEEFTRRTTSGDNSSPVNIQNHPNLSLLPKRCGNIDSDKIYGGQRTNLFEMPWMVILSYHTGRAPTFSCGGTLINEWYVLTAAHCVSELKGSLELDGVILGEYDIRTNPDCVIVEGEETCAPAVRNVTIQEIKIHPGYTYTTLNDDIALIRLAEPADFTQDSMKPMCLPVTSELQTESLVGRISVVAGWGFTEEGLQSPVLQRVDLPVISKEECIKMFKGSRFITDKLICAGGVKDKDSCGGDSGGPLMYPGVFGRQGAQYVQRGIVSYGPKRCGIGTLPGVYTNIAYYMDWILDNIRS